MDLKVLGSSSKGNCYILDNGSEALMIEAGVDFRKVKRALGYDLSRLVGCVITHEHKDHSRYVGDVLKAGVRTLALPSVFENVKNTVFAKTIEDGKMCLKLGEYISLGNEWVNIFQNMRHGELITMNNVLKLYGQRY